MFWTTGLKELCNRHQNQGNENCAGKRDLNILSEDTEIQISRQTPETKFLKPWYCRGQYDNGNKSNQYPSHTVILSYSFDKFHC